jgi:GxxExxY protein
MELERETFAINGVGMEVHSQLGPGYDEPVYHEAMEVEFGHRNIPYVSEPEMKVIYKGKFMKKKYRPDFMVFDAVVVEIKAHSAPLSKVDSKRLINSLTASGKKVGLLINFGRDSLEHHRFVN